MRDTAAGELPTRDDLSGEEEEKHDGTSDNRRAAGRGGGRNDDPTGGEKSCIHIPTLCYHEDLSIKAVCRICVVEVEGQRLLPTACSTPVSEGMVVQTASPKVLKARRNILELIFARHPQECLVCPKDGKCDLQKVAQDVGMHLDIRYDKQLRHQKEDWSSPAIMRNPQKCILCGRCMEVCNEIQGINVLSKENRGFHTLIAPAYGEKLADTNCINCGQCVQVCPTGA